MSQTLDKSSFTREGLRRWGFEGFETIGYLRRSALHDAPYHSGVHVVLRPELTPPIFRSRSSGGRWQGRDPNVPLESLKAAWLDDAVVLYIGKASTLKERIGLLLEFGAGQNVPHFGGRYLWHLDRTDLLEVAWVVTKPAEAPSDRARGVENLLIRAFRQIYGARPFANLRD